MPSIAGGTDGDNGRGPFPCIPRTFKDKNVQAAAGFPQLDFIITNRHRVAPLISHEFVSNRLAIQLVKHDNPLVNMHSNTNTS
jgi:hypothetical protein